MSNDPKPETIYEHALIDPRAGDVEDDASSTKQRPLAAIAGSILAEISLAKFLVVWILLVVVPGIVLGLGPLVLTAWLSGLTERLVALSGLGSIIVLGLLTAIGVYGLRPLLRIVERSFWAFQAIVVQPVYAAFREVLAQFAEKRLPLDSDTLQRTRRRSITALIAGLLSSAVGLSVAALVWPHTRWEGTFADLVDPVRLVIPALANAVAIGGSYLALAASLWAIADATMHQPQAVRIAGSGVSGGNRFRIAHLSDLHTVGEPYGFRIESGRAGPRGNERVSRLFDRLSEEQAHHPLDLVLITGDMTDTGRSAEWIAFLDIVARHPGILARTLILPGNHDVNVVDRSNPARFELPTSPMKQLRQMRALSAMVAVQGDRVRVYDRRAGRLGETLAERVAPYSQLIRDLANRQRITRSLKLAQLWADCFPQIVPPKNDDGLGIMLLNSNAESNFSFTNALGLLPAEDVKVVRSVMDQFPKAGWVLGLHHHLVEYPMPVANLSERIGTALINGSWVVRQLKPVSSRSLVMHGHRHIDWIGQAEDGIRVSAPSPVMEARDSDETCFYVQNVSIGPGGSLDLGRPERKRIAGTPTVD